MSSLQSLSHWQQQNCSGCAFFYNILYTSRVRHSENIKWKLIFRFAELSHYSPNSKPFIRHYHDCSTKCERVQELFCISLENLPSSILYCALQTLQSANSIQSTATRTAIGSAVSITCCNDYKLLWDIISYDFSQSKWLIRALNWRPLRHHYETSHLTSLVFVNSKVPAFLNVVDIAGLVKGASEGQGLGNAFLSHINACDAIFHLCRKFQLESLLLCWKQFSA